MDPQAAWRMLLDAYQDRDWPLVAEKALALVDWRAGGGFVPQVSTDGPRYDGLIVELVCRQALQRAAEQGEQSA